VIEFHKIVGIYSELFFVIMRLLSKRDYMKYPIIFSCLYLICQQNENSDYDLKTVKLILELEGFDPQIADQQLEAYKIVDKESLLNTCIQSANDLEAAVKVRCMGWILIALEANQIVRPDVSKLFFTICTHRLNLSVFDVLNINKQLTHRLSKFSMNRLSAYL